MACARCATSIVIGKTTVASRFLTPTDAGVFTPPGSTEGTSNRLSDRGEDIAGIAGHVGQRGVVRQLGRHTAAARLSCDDVDAPERPKAIVTKWRLVRRGCVRRSVRLPLERRERRS